VLLVLSILAVIVLTGLVISWLLRRIERLLDETGGD
jgi:hypothetical protein